MPKPFESTRVPVKPLSSLSALMWIPPNAPPFSGTVRPETASREPKRQRRLRGRIAQSRLAGILK